MRKGFCIHLSEWLKGSVDFTGKFIWLCKREPITFGKWELCNTMAHGTASKPTLISQSELLVAVSLWSLSLRQLLQSDSCHGSLCTVFWFILERVLNQNHYFTYHFSLFYIIRFNQESFWWSLCLADRGSEICKVRVRLFFYYFSVNRHCGSFCIRVSSHMYSCWIGTNDWQPFRFPCLIRDPGEYSMWNRPLSLHAHHCKE